VNGEGEEIFSGYMVLGSGTGRAKLLELWLWSGTAMPAFWRFQTQFFSRFLESCLDNYLQNNLKQQKNKQNKSN